MLRYPRKRRVDKFTPVSCAVAVLQVGLQKEYAGADQEVHSGESGHVEEQLILHQFGEP